MNEFFTFIGNQIYSIFKMLYDIKVPLFNGTPLLYVLLFCGVILFYISDTILEIFGRNKSDGSNNG